MANCGRLHVTTGESEWQHELAPSRLGIRSERIASGSASRACGLSRFGFLTCAPPPLWHRRTVNPSPLPKVLMRRRTRTLLTQSLIGAGVKRGEIWTVAGGNDYARKPRPVVILQDDRVDMTDSVTVCAFTTDPTDAPLFRLLIKPSENNGLRVECRLMADKVTTVPKTKIGACVGRLADEDMVRLNRAVLVFLGIAAPTGNEQLEPA